MSVLTVQIAVLDAAAESLLGVRSLLLTAAADTAEALSGMATAVPDSAVADELSGVPVPHLADVLAGRAHGLAARVADGARVYREMEAALLGEVQRAGGAVPVPR